MKSNQYKHKIHTYTKQFTDGNITCQTLLQRLNWLESDCKKRKDLNPELIELFASAKRLGQRYHTPDEEAATKNRLDRLRRNKYPKLIKDLETKYAKGEINAHQMTLKAQHYQSLIDMPIDKYYSRWLSQNNKKKRKKSSRSSRRSGKNVV